MASGTGAAADRPVMLFYSYAHDDEALRDELQGHLMILERRGVIRSWHDRAIVAGHDWSHEIDDHIRAADVVLLLISKDFFASDYIIGAELALAMQRQKWGETVVVPILLRSVDLQPEDAKDMPFVDLLKTQGLPRDLKPVTSWNNRDEAWTNVARGLRATVNEIRERWKTEAPAKDAASKALSASPAHEELLDRVVDNFTRRIAQANVDKGGPALDESSARRQAVRLINIPDPKRVLWVDDHPENNMSEAAALANLQIEVVTALSTNEALIQLAEATASGEAFDLVISDWSRPAEGRIAPAGIRLITEMRERGYRQPVIYYHGTFSPAARTALAATTRVAGAFGEAILPDDLMRLVLAALETHKS